VTQKLRAPVMMWYGQEIGEKSREMGVGFTLSSLVSKIADVKDVPTSHCAIFLGLEP